MCLGIAGKIVELNTAGNDLATADVMGAQRTINIGLVKESLRAGDWVVIHVGFAIAKMEEKEARASLALLRQLGGINDDADFTAEDAPASGSKNSKKGKP